MKAKSNKKLGLTSKIFIALICGMILGIVMHYFVPKGHIKDDIIIDGIFLFIRSNVYKSYANASCAIGIFFNR